MCQTSSGGTSAAGGNSHRHTAPPVPRLTAVRIGQDTGWAASVPTLNSTMNTAVWSATPNGGTSSRAGWPDRYPFTAAHATKKVTTAANVFARTSADSSEQSSAAASNEIMTTVAAAG